jgi:[ribosomal protein S18]-alanine N-acetyltransferase
MNTYNFKPMTEDNASAICNWKYDGLYSIYSMDGSNECICELMNGDYFFVMDNTNGLVGYICSGNSARVPGGYQNGIYDNSRHLDIGLGIRPDFTGKGIGQQFLSQGINFLKEQLKVQNFQLVVAMFNERAIKVYERAGFIKGLRFKSKVDDQEIDFIVMKNSLKNE